MEDAIKNAANEGSQVEDGLSSEQLEEVAGGAQRWSVCPKCGQGDKIVKKVYRGSMVKFYCTRCDIALN